ncbi:DNRLRE domain-containing protein [Anaerocolumna sp. AGMB13025]|uniref:DNRLRE domain-containing protein n=1 Tax=Anaerocolumna sp. AGMB13025 TaxID=3039116 RepID=UPI00241DC67B|nr:DNRLRE domain-containing protein [Anaerocolumna sp. AGMB13025]WFR55142.1 DNRLRE domain-containing protein [Anaerocolumna sp. AGMB13025]
MPVSIILPSDDTFIASGYPTTVFGSYPFLYIGVFIAPGDNYRTLLKFDLSAIPQGNTITQAELNLYIYRKDVPGPELLSIYLNQSDFNENTVTYLNAPAITPTGITATVTDADVNTFFGIDITPLVQQWYQNPATNNGITIIGPENTYSLIGSYSTNVSDSSFYPFLQVTYESSCNCTSDFISDVTQSGDYTIYESNTLLLNQRVLGTFSVVNNGFTDGLAVLQILNGSSIWVDEKSAQVRPGQTKVLTTTASRLDERISIVSIISPIISGTPGGTLNANDNLFNPNNVALTFSSDNPDFIVDPNTGIITINNSGSATITVTTKNIDGPSISFTVIAVGNNSVYNQTQGIFYATIQQAINAANPGDVIQVGPGNYPENVTIDKRITLNGSGSGVGGTIINPASGVGIAVSMGGLNSAQRLVISNLQVTGASQGISTIGSNQPSHITISNVALLNNSNNGFNINVEPAFPVMTDLIVTDSNFSNNVIAGFRVPTYAQVSEVTIQNSMFNGNANGILVFSGTATFNNINITNSQFNNNTSKGMYYEALNNAFLTNNTINNSGTAGSFAAGIDINLKNGNYQNVNLINNTVTNSGNGDPVNGAAAVIKGRNDGTNNGTLTDVTVSGGTYSNAPVGIRFGETGQNNSYPTNTVVTGATIANNGIGLQNVTTVTITQNNNTFINNGINLVGSFN